MKLLIIVAVKEFEKNIKQLLKESGIQSYSYKEVVGYQDANDQLLESNWFATQGTENESVLFYVFAAEEKTTSFFELVKQFNTQLDTISQIHVAQVCIEKTI